MNVRAFRIGTQLALVAPSRRDWASKNAAADLEVELDFGRDANGVVQTETLHAPELDSREAHITTSTKTDSLKQGKCSVTVPHATRVRVTVG